MQFNTFKFTSNSDGIDRHILPRRQQNRHYKLHVTIHLSSHSIRQVQNQRLWLITPHVRRTYCTCNCYKTLVSRARTHISHVIQMLIKCAMGSRVMIRNFCPTHLPNDVVFCFVCCCSPALPPPPPHISHSSPVIHSLSNISRRFSFPRPAWRTSLTQPHWLYYLWCADVSNYNC